MAYPITENGYTHFRRFDILSHHQLQDALRMAHSVRPVADDDLFEINF